MASWYVHGTVTDQFSDRNTNYTQGI